jgi:penicillin-binding protein 1A
MEFFDDERGPAPRSSEPAAAPSQAPPLLSAGLHDRIAAPAKSFLKNMPRRTKLAIMVPLAAFAFMFLGFASLLIYYTVVFPNPLEARQKEPSPVVRILARDGSVLAERGTAHDYMPLSLLPRRVTDAVVATEDRRFYSHWGVDPSGMVRAMFANLRAGRFAQGGSTLTQQLAKNMFLTSDRTMSRKLEEFALAVWLEVRLSKDDILELYLNRVYFGAGAYGIEAGAQRYFDKSARELNLAEAAVIAGLLKAPSKYSPASNPEQALTRGQSVLNKMLDAGVITADEHRRAGLDRVRFSPGKRTREDAGVDYAVDFVLERLPPLAGSGHAEIVVETTLDANLQKRAAQIVASELNANGNSLAASQAAVVVLDLEGGIRALVGGKNYAESQYNRAVKAQRQPGSAFKPILYLSAIEAGYTPESLVYDTPLTIAGWSPRNDSGKYIGAVTLRHALALSINSVAARLFSEVGARTVVATARRLGITTELRQDPSLALGTSEVSLMELTGAYGVFANSGRSIEPHCIRRVRMSSGRVLYARDVQGEAQVVAPTHVAAMNDMLRAGMSWGTGRRATLAGHMAGGKTGTTQDFRDAWFVGYTSHLAAGVWVGNDNGRPMNKVMGGSLPAGIWQQIMTVAHQGMAPVALPGVDALSAPPSRGEQLSATGQGFEDLPWLREAGLSTETGAVEARPAPVPSQPQSVARAPKAPVFPKEAIDADFIARALSTPAPDAGTLAAKDQMIPPSLPAQRVQQLPSGRLVVRPPAGMMSLGVPAQ